jgi:hypothetical protein
MFSEVHLGQPEIDLQKERELKSLIDVESPSVIDLSPDGLIQGSSWKAK